MSQADLIFYIIKLSLGGLTAFTALLLWGRTRDGAWMSLVAGVLIRYAGTVYEMMQDFGIVFSSDIYIFGIPVLELLFAVLPMVFIILAFVLMIFKTK